MPPTRVGVPMPDRGASRLPAASIGSSTDVPIRAGGPRGLSPEPAVMGAADCPALERRGAVRQS
jgi:hypothetical protein